MPIKDGDKVFFKIQSGAVRTGKYDGKTKMVMLAGGKKAKPPKKALFHTRAAAMKNAFMGASNPNPELGAAPRKKAVPKGSHRMPDGSIMKDNDPKMKSSKNKKEKATPKKTPTKKGRVFVKKNGGSGTDFATIKEATDDIQKSFRSNDFSNLRVYGKMEKAHDEGREVGFKVKFMMRAEKSKREEAGKDKPSDDNVTVTPYYTNADGSITDTRKTIAKATIDNRKYKVEKMRR